MSDQHDTPHPEPEQRRELFVEFANTLELEDGRPVDHVAEPARLAAWLEQNGVCARVPASRLRTAMPAFRELRSLVRDVVARIAAGSDATAPQLRRLNAVLREGLHYHQVRRAAHG